VSKLEELGINLGLSVAGFFGSVFFIEKGKDLRETLVAMCGGVASANYLTPVVSDWFGIEKINHQFSVAFILGFMGLKGVERIAHKLFNQKSKS
jgi:hypothetical protein